MAKKKATEKAIEKGYEQGVSGEPEQPARASDVPRPNTSSRGGLAKERRDIAWDGEPAKARRKRPKRPED